MEYKQRYKKVFSQIHPMNEFDPEELYRRKPYKSITKKAISLAAAIALLTSLCLTAYGMNLFGLRDLLLPQDHEAAAPAVSGEPQQQAQSMDMISLAGYNNTPEARATAEWQAFLNTYDQDGVILSQIGNAPTGFEEHYLFYQVYTQEMADKLEDIIARYDLKLHTAMIDDLYTGEALCDQVGGNFLGENRSYSAYMYEDGTLKFDGEINLDDYGHLDYQFMRCVRGSFTDIVLNIVDIHEYTEWSYVTGCGVPVTLALSPRKALIIADLPDSFITINVLAGTETPYGGTFSYGPFDAQDLERFADSFDFSLLTPALPANPALPRPSLDAALHNTTAEDFFRITGLEEPRAQVFYAQLIGNIEADDRLAVAEMLYYPTEVTYWNTSEAGTYLVYETVECAEDFLPFYDLIFTENLWWDCISANQYDRERAALASEQGMVVAAGGAIRFAGTEDDDIKVFVIQNEGECTSIHQP